MKGRRNKFKGVAPKLDKSLCLMTVLRRERRINFFLLSNSVAHNVIYLVQVEAEILLQRHKTLVRVCRGLSPRPSRPPQAPGGRDARSRPRTVRVRRSPHLGLGISVTVRSISSLLL